MASKDSKTSLVWLAICIFALVTVESSAAQPMPLMPSSYSTKTLLTLWGTDQLNDTIPGDIFMDGVHYWIRTDQVNHNVSIETLTFYNGTAFLNYVIENGVNCSKTVSLAEVPNKATNLVSHPHNNKKDVGYDEDADAGEDEDDEEEGGYEPCDSPVYQGTEVIDGQNTQYWKMECYFPTYQRNTTTLYYWNGDTPVRTLNIEVSRFDNATSQLDYFGFVAGVPDPSYFVVPSVCD